MKHAVQMTKVSHRFALEAPNLNTMVDLPPVEWFVRGPRGGLYIATGQRERYVGEFGDDFMTGMVSVVDRSEGLRYVRPGSPLAKRADV